MQVQKRFSSCPAAIAVAAAATILAGGLYVRGQAARNAGPEVTEKNFVGASARFEHGMIYSYDDIQVGRSGTVHVKWLGGLVGYPAVERTARLSRAELSQLIRLIDAAHLPELAQQKPDPRRLLDCDAGKTTVRLRLKGAPPSARKLGQADREYVVVSQDLQEPPPSYQALTDYLIHLARREENGV